MKVGGRKTVKTARLNYDHLMAYQRIERVRSKTKEKLEAKLRKQKERTKKKLSRRKHSKKKKQNY